MSPPLSKASTPKESKPKPTPEAPTPLWRKMLPYLTVILFAILVLGVVYGLAQVGQQSISGRILSDNATLQVSPATFNLGNVRPTEQYTLSSNIYNPQPGPVNFTYGFAYPSGSYPVSAQVLNWPLGEYRTIQPASTMNIQIRVTIGEPTTAPFDFTFTVTYTGERT